MSDFIVREFQPADADAFFELNREWIQRYFWLEPADLEVLWHPETAILDTGGRIFMAERNGVCIGCCALIAIGPGEYELAKMAVTPAERRHGVGRRLIAAAIAMAERIAPATAARLAAVLDCGEVAVERDGLKQRQATRFGVVAFDEGITEDEHLSPALADRLAFRVELGAVAEQAMRPDGFDARRVLDARNRLSSVTIGTELIQCLCAAALALGLTSTRASLLAVRVARV